MFFHGLFHRPELIPEHGGALEVELIGSLQHGPAQLFEQLARTPRKQEFHALDQRLVGRLGHVLRAWREALADVVVQAGADPVFERPVGAAAQGEGAMDGSPGFPRGKAGGEGAEVERVIVRDFAALGQAHHFKARVGDLAGDAKQHILFVVAQDDVVMGPVSLDQAGFKQQRLFFRACGKGFQRFGMTEHGHGFWRKRGGVAKVGQDALAQIAGLAHINDPSPGVLVQVHAGSDRQGCRNGALHGMNLLTDQ